MNRNKIKNQKGFSLLETLVAISILVVAITGSLTLASTSIGSASLSKNQIIAFNLAEEGMELVRSVRDSNSAAGRFWLEGLEPCVNPSGCTIDAWSSAPAIEPCLTEACQFIKYDSDSGAYGYHISGQRVGDTIFSRKIQLSPVSDYEEKVEVSVEWRQARFDRPAKIILEERIFDWWPAAI